MRKTRVLALFRNPVSYINPLLKEFGKQEEIELLVVFSVKPKEVEDRIPNVTVRYLSGAEHANDRNERSEREYKIIQRDVRDQIKNWKPDVLFIATSYWSPTTWIALSEAKRKKIPMITRMTVQTGKKRGKWLLLVKKIVVGQYLKNMNAGVYECEKQKEYLLQYGLTADKLFYSPCAVDNKYFRSQYESVNGRQIRNEKGVADDELVLVFVGKLLPIKRPIDILLALEMMPQKMDNIRLYYIGDGELLPELQLKAKEVGKDRVRFTGQLSHEKMIDYLCMADVFLLPSENDASPKALNEAMNFDLAVIVSDGIETASELVKENDNGYTYPVGDISALALCIDKLAKDRQRLEIMKKRSGEIIQDFSFDNAVHGWMQAIRLCTGGEVE